MEDDIKQDKKLIKRAFGMHDKQEHKGQHTDLSKLKTGGKIMKKHKMKEGSAAEERGESKAFEAKEDESKEMRKGGKVKKMAKGGMAEVMGPKSMSKDVEAGSNNLKSFGESKVQKRGDTKGKNLGDSGPTRMCGGGMKKMARGGGIESKGKTRGRFC